MQFASIEVQHHTRPSKIRLPRRCRVNEDWEMAPCCLLSRCHCCNLVPGVNVFISNTGWTKMYSLAGIVTRFIKDKADLVFNFLRSLIQFTKWSESMCLTTEAWVTRDKQIQFCRLWTGTTVCGYLGSKRGQFPKNLIFTLYNNIDHEIEDVPQQWIRFFAIIPLYD